VSDRLVRFGFLRSVTLLALAVALFFGSAWGASRVSASISWADLHLTQSSGFGGTSVNVTHFLESGTESCSETGQACYFEVEWFQYYPDFGWYLSGWASHSTDLNWEYEHASNQFPQAWPKMHNFTWHDTHGQSNWNYTTPCSSWVVSRVMAYDMFSTYLSYNLSNQIYYNLC
jgi:hypothetical protein